MDLEDFEEEVRVLGKFLFLNFVSVVALENDNEGDDEDFLRFIFYYEIRVFEIGMIVWFKY